MLFLRRSPFCLFETGSLIDLEFAMLTALPGQRVLEICFFFLLPEFWGFKSMPPCLAFFLIGSGGLTKVLLLART